MEIEKVEANGWLFDIHVMFVFFTWFHVHL